MRAASPILLVALLAGIAGAAEVRLTPRTMKVEERLALPRFRVAVGPGLPLTLAGRAKPITFEANGERLIADLDGDGVHETEVRARQPVSVPLDDGDPPEVRSLAFLSGDPEAGEPRWSAVVLDVLEGKTPAGKLLFVDHDADGVFLTRHRDFLVPKRKGAPPHPVAPVFVLGRHAYRLAVKGPRTIEIEKDAKFGTPDLFPRWTDVADGIEHLNGVRAAMNLPPVGLSREASRHALLHVKYLERNGGNGHLERWDFPGYTKEGAKAGINSLGHLGPGSVRTAIDGHLGSLLHRIELIDPRSSEFGIAAAGSRIWIHTEWGKRRPWDDQGPVIFPGPNRCWAVGTYSGENPDPRPEGAKGGSGLPVTVAFFDAEGVMKVRADLRSRGGRPAFWRSDADGRELKTNHDACRAAIMTKANLKRGPHRLTVTWLQDRRPCRLVYDFRIGR